MQALAEKYVDKAVCPVTHNRLRASRSDFWVSGAATGSVFLGTACTTVAALRVVGQIDHAMLVWPVTGVALALVLPHWQTTWRKRGSLLLSVACGFWLVARALNMPSGIAAMIAVLTCVDVAIGGAILGRAVRCFDDLKQQANIAKFFLATILLPLLTGSIGSYPLAHFLKEPLLATGLMNVFSNSLGIAIMLPATLLIQGELRLLFRRVAAQAAQMTATAVLFVGIVSCVFWQTTNPFLFMVFPPMILLLLVWGLEGALFTSTTILVVGWFATFHQHGPIWLARGGAPLHHLLLFQGFSWICVATAMPVGALLDERRRADHDHKEAQSVYRVLLEHAEDLIVLSAMDGSHRYVSPGITRLAGYTREEYLALDRLDTVHPDDLDAVKHLLQSLSVENPDYLIRYRMRQKNGDWRWVESSVRAYGIEGEKIAGYVGTVRDISSLKETEEKWQQEKRGLIQQSRDMANLANTDSLTGLLNRRGLTDCLRIAGRRSDRVCALLMIDVDHFKRYNDLYGHPAGDRCLVVLADMLRSQTARHGDLVARLGGEEFAVLLKGASLQQALKVGERIRLAMLGEALAHSSSPIGLVTISIGVAAKADENELDLELLAAKADAALYRSKRARNCVTACADDEEVLAVG